MRVSDAVNHQYLTSGCSPGSEADNASSLLPMEPVKLHFAAPVVELPSKSRGQGPTYEGDAADGSGGGSSGEDDQLWARRQFSVIWAPMPSDLKMSGDGAGGEDWDQQSPLTAYEMSVIAETSAERNCPFVL
jgi:hypothetical protein